VSIVLRCAFNVVDLGQIVNIFFIFFHALQANAVPTISSMAYGSGMAGMTPAYSKKRAKLKSLLFKHLHTAGPRRRVKALGLMVYLNR
jgi:hypothetical protein